MHRFPPHTTVDAHLNGGSVSTESFWFVEQFSNIKSIMITLTLTLRGRSSLGGSVGTLRVTREPLLLLMSRVLRALGVGDDDDDPAG